MPDDETINQMLARGEEEFEIYQVTKTFPQDLSVIFQENRREKTFWNPIKHCHFDIFIWSYSHDVTSLWYNGYNEYKSCQAWGTGIPFLHPILTVTKFIVKKFVSTLLWPKLQPFHNYKLSEMSKFKWKLNLVSHGLYLSLTFFCNYYWFCVIDVF